MMVVSNTSPLSNLAIIDRLELLRAQLGHIGIPHAGVLSVLRHAKQSGQIISLASEVRRLRTEAHFFISPALEKRLLAAVGE